MRAVAVRHAIRRARARRRSAGAVLFIVAVTLGLLAVMGVYGLSATNADIKSAGHMREALQAQRAAETALIMTAETYNPTVAQKLVSDMNNGKGQTRDCLTAVPYLGTTTETRAAEACMKFTPDQMVIAANTSNTAAPAQWVVSSAPAVPPFTLQSFGPVVNAAYITVEVTNPINTVVPGFSQTGNAPIFSYSQLTVTTFVQLKQGAALAAESSVAARGRITVGPSAASAGAPSNF